MEVDIKYWRSVLQWVVFVVKKLSRRGLTFRGSDEKFRSLRSGSYMMSLELITEFDHFLADLIARYGNPGSGRGRTFYLSSTIGDEMISLMSKRFKENYMLN